MKTANNRFAGFGPVITALVLFVIVASLPKAKQGGERNSYSKRKD